MKRAAIFLIVPLCFFLLVSCSKRQTPDYVLEAYAELKAELDPDTVGDNMAKLEAFKKKYSLYAITVVVDEEILQWNDKAKLQVKRAKNLARKGDLDRAQRILEDLAQTMPSTNTGKEAQQYLAFKIPMFRINQFMSEGQLYDAEATLLELREQVLTPHQTRQVETMLDNVSLAKKNQFRVACQSLYAEMRTFQAKNREYPGHISINTFRYDNATIRDRIEKNILRVEDYRRDGGEFRLVAVAKDGKTRMEITHRGVGRSLEPKDDSESET